MTPWTAQTPAQAPQPHKRPSRWAAATARHAAADPRQSLRPALTLIPSRHALTCQCDTKQSQGWQLGVTPQHNARAPRKRLRAARLRRRQPLQPLCTLNTSRDNGAGLALAAHCRGGAPPGLKPLHTLAPRCAAQAAAGLLSAHGLCSLACALVLHPTPLTAPACTCMLAAGAQPSLSTYSLSFDLFDKQRHA